MVTSASLSLFKFTVTKHKAWLKQPTAWTGVYVEKLNVCMIDMQMDGAQGGHHHSNLLGTRRCNSIWLPAEALSHQHSSWSSHTSVQVTARMLVLGQLLAVGCHVLRLCLFSLLASALQQLAFIPNKLEMLDRKEVVHVIIMKLLYTCHAGMMATSEVQRDCSK